MLACSIESLWNASEEPTITVSRVSHNNPITIVHVDNSKAIGYYGHAKDTISEKAFVFDAEKIQWLAWSEPVAIDHWPAVRTTNSSNTDYSLTAALYHSKEQAENGLGRHFVRLATELTPLKLVPKG